MVVWYLDVLPSVSEAKPSPQTFCLLHQNKSIHYTLPILWGQNPAQFAVLGTRGNFAFCKGLVNAPLTVAFGELACQLKPSLPSIFVLEDAILRLERTLCCIALEVMPMGKGYGAACPAIRALMFSQHALLLG